MRVVAIKAWYEHQTYQADFADNAALVAWWRSLPDDGALAFRIWFDEFAPVRLGRFVSGNSWYFLLAGDDPSIDGYEGPLDELVKRYPNAVPKRGKLVGEARFKAVCAEMVAAIYWGDEDEDDYVLVGCGGCV